MAEIGKSMLPCACDDYIFQLSMTLTALGLAHIGGRDQVSAAPLLHGDGAADQRHQRPADDPVEAEDPRMSNVPRQPLSESRCEKPWNIFLISLTVKLLRWVRAS